jgi:HPt (histidine-containing phosphotransfer) domain-containing protein
MPEIAFIVQPQWDPTEALQRASGNEPLLRQLVRIFVEETPKQMENLRNAIDSADAKTVEETAHRLRGELNYFGLSSTAHEARELERLGREHNLRSAPQIFKVFNIELSAGLKSMQQMLDNETI